MDEKALERISALHDAGQRAWPGVALPVGDFVRHLARRLPPGTAPAAFLDAVHAADLYLACACALGLPAALATFERDYLRQVPALLTGLSLSPSQVDEVCQLLRDKLLLARPGEEPKIAGYSGRGPLMAFLRVAARRTALTLLSQQGPAHAAADPDRLAAQDTSPEVRHLRQRHQEALKGALQEAIAGLPGQQRAALRLHFLQGLTDEKIGRMFRVHRTTVTRWIDAARERILDESRRLLGERLRLSPTECDSLAAALRSQIDLSLAELLKESRQ